jgi:DNA-binding IclR family transcriptional regulator
LTKHAQVLLCVARDPEIRLRDIATAVDLTERRVHSILGDLVVSGYVSKAKTGRRNRYEVREHLPLPDLTDRVRAISEMLHVLAPDQTL